MGLATFTQRLGRRMFGLDDPPLGTGSKDHLYGLSLENFLGGLPDYVASTRRNAMTIGTVANARHRLVGTVGRLPLIARRGGSRVPQAEQPALLGQLQPGTPLATTLGWTVDSLFFYPCAWWLVRHRDYYGWPDQVEWIEWGRTTRDDKGRLIKVDNQPVDAADVIRFDSPLGEGYLKNARRDIQRAIAINLAAAKVEDSPIPAVSLRDVGGGGADLTPAQIDTILDKWLEQRRKYGAAWIPKNIEMATHGKPVDALLIDGRKAIALDLLRHTALPAWSASVAVEGGTMTYDNRESHNWELIDLGAHAYMTAITGRISMPDVTPRGWTVEMPTDELTRPDQKTRFESYEIGIRGGFIDNAWIAEQEGWATVPADAPKEAA